MTLAVRSRQATRFFEQAGSAGQTCRRQPNDDATAPSHRAPWQGGIFQSAPLHLSDKGPRGIIR